MIPDRQCPGNRCMRPRQSWRPAPISIGCCPISRRHVTSIRIFSTAFSAFREAVDRAGLELPAGQLTHVLRHTFASHFMMNGGNILTLQRILGHANLTMTMRYAHLSPEHLQEARMLNPVSRLDGEQMAFGARGDRHDEAKRPLCGSAWQYGNDGS